MNTTLVADGQQPRQGGADRKVTDVAVGVLLLPDGSFLLTSRPKGKVYEGYWEFPGGKLEAGETVEQALRELLEQIETLESVTFSRDLEPYKAEACWDDAILNARAALAAHPSEG